MLGVVIRDLPLLIQIAVKFEKNGTLLNYLLVFYKVKVFLGYIPN